MLQEPILKSGTFLISVPTRVVPVKWAVIIVFLLFFAIYVAIVMRQNWEDCFKQEAIGKSFLTIVVAIVIISYVFGGNLFSNKTFRELTAEVDINSPKVQEFFKNEDGLLEAQKHMRFDFFGTKFYKSDGKVYFSTMLPIRQLKKLESEDNGSIEEAVNGHAEYWLKKAYNKSGKAPLM